MAIVGTYTVSVPEAPQVSDGGHSTTANLSTHAESPCGSPSSLRGVPEQGGEGRGRGQ